MAQTIPFESTATKQVVLWSSEAPYVTERINVIYNRTNVKSKV